MDDDLLRRMGMGTPPPGGCTSCYVYGVICALVGASLQAVGLQVLSACRPRESSSVQPNENVRAVVRDCLRVHSQLLADNGVACCPAALEAALFARGNEVGARSGGTCRRSDGTSVRGETFRHVHLKSRALTYHALRVCVQPASQPQRGLARGRYTVYGHERKLCRA